MMSKFKADVVVDLQFGSTGKGLICGWLSRLVGYDTVISANMPNAGHTYIENGHKWVHKVLPSGIFVKENIMIAPGAVFDPERLRYEIDQSMAILHNKNIFIHEAAGVLSQKHREAEQNTLSKISSTMQGSSECMKDRISRKDNTIARDCIGVLKEFGLDKFVVTQKEWLDVLFKSRKILVEGSQGYSLGISSGFYPYCTSRDCTASRVAADCGIPPGMVNKVIGVARCHPIRVGNTSDGYSGGFYDDQRELSWESLGVEPEKTTVTGRIRRVFTFSSMQIEEAILANGVDEIFLNFVNYDPEYANDIINEIKTISKFNGLDCEVTTVGTGPSFDDVMSVKLFNDYLLKYRESNKGDYYD